MNKWGRAHLIYILPTGVWRQSILIDGINGDHEMHTVGSYSEGIRFEYWEESRTAWVRFFFVLLSSISKIPGYYLKQATIASFQILSNSSPTSHSIIRRYTAYILAAS
jgi:hypothetical protein